MARYIDADELVKYLKENIQECETPRIDTEPIAYGSVLGLRCAMSYAETLPTADVVEVVRCKECKFHNRHEEDDYGTCTISGVYLATYDFCSLAERKGGAE